MPALLSIVTAARSAVSNPPGEERLSWMDLLSRLLETQKVRNQSLGIFKGGGREKGKGIIVVPVIASSSP